MLYPLNCHLAFASATFTSAFHDWLWPGGGGVLVGPPLICELWALTLPLPLAAEKGPSPTPSLHCAWPPRPLAVWRAVAVPSPLLTEEDPPGRASSPSPRSRQTQALSPKGPSRSSNGDDCTCICIALNFGTQQLIESPKTQGSSTVIPATLRTRSAE